MIVILLSTSDWLSHTSVKKPTFNRSSYHLLQYKKKLYLECFKRKHTKQQSTKKKKKTLTNKHETTLNFECPTGISHLQLGQPSYSLGDRHSPSHHQHYLLGGMAYSKGTDFGRREQKVSRVGAAATSSVRSFQSLFALGKKENFL